MSKMLPCGVNHFVAPPPPIVSNVGGNGDIKNILNTCRSNTGSYTKITELREDCPYRIAKLERVTTTYGETVMVILEGLVGDDYYLRVYLPRRYNEVLTDRTIEDYNAGYGDRLHLVRRSAVAGSKFTPLEFV
jgi:hypothetical protein